MLQYPRLHRGSSSLTVGTEGGSPIDMESIGVREPRNPLRVSRVRVLLAEEKARIQACSKAYLSGHILLI